MAAVRETLYRFQADAGDVVSELRKLQAEVAKASQDKSFTIGAQVGKALQDVGTLHAAVEELSKERPEITAHLNVGRLVGDVVKAKAILQGIPDSKEVVINSKVDLDIAKAEGEIKRIETQIEKLKRSNPEVVVQARVAQAYAQLAIIDDRLVKLNKKKATPAVQLKIDKAMADSDLLIARIEEMEKIDARIQVNADVAKALIDMELAKRKRDELVTKRANIQIGVDRSQMADLGRAADIVGSVMSQVERAGRAAERAATPTLNLAGAWNTFSTSMRRVSPILTGVAVTLAVALIPGILALVAALGGAVGAAGALAIAFGSALLPAIIGAVAVFSRLSAVMNVFKQREAALKQARDGAAQAANQATANEEALRNARRSVGDANRGVVQAERNLREARSQARENIAEAEQRYASAVQDSRRAADDLAQATVDAYREIKDAIEDASDAQLAFQDAQLSQEEASLGIKEASLELKKFRQEAGAAGAGIDSLFKKFTDVDVDTTGLSSAIKNAVGGPGGGLDEEEQLKLERLILNVRRAKLREKEATDKVSDSEQDLNDKTREANRLRRTGIGGVDGYKDALNRYRDAQDKANDAQSDMVELQKKGISGAPAVISATDGLADANRRAFRASQDLAGTQKRVHDQLGPGAAALAAYRAEFEKLSPAEKRYEKLLESLNRTQKNVFGGLREQVINAIVDVVTGLQGAAGPLTTFFNLLGTSWANFIRNFGGQVADFGNLAKIQTILQGTLSISDSLGTAFQNAFQILLNIASAAMPFVEQLAADFSTWLGTLSKGTSDAGALQAALAPAVETLRLFGSIGVNAVAAVWNVFQAGSGPINDFVKWIRDGVKAFSDWAKSTGGKNEIKKFFQDTLPAVKSLIKFVVKLGIFFLRAFQVLLPVMKPIVDFFNFILDVLNLLLGLLAKIPTPIKTAIGVLLTFFLPFGKVGELAGRLATKFGTFAEAVGGLLGVFKRVGGRIVNTIAAPFGKLWDLFRTFFPNAAKTLAATAGRVGGAAKKVAGVLLTPFRIVGQKLGGVFTAAKKPIGDVIRWIGDRFKALKDVFGRLLKPITSAAKAIWDGIKGAFHGAGTFLEKLFGGFVRTIKGAINLIIDGLNIFVKGLNKLSFHVPKWVPKIGGKGFDLNVPEIPKIPLAGGGLATGPASALIGEAGREAVLPLTHAVFNELARGVVRQLRVLRPAGALAGAGGAGVVYNQQIHISSPPAAVPDPRHAAASLARELRLRGGR